MNTQKKLTRFWIVIALLGCGLALIALAGEAVSAQPLRPELKPPFKFAERTAAPAAQTPPPGSTVLMTETFGASFAPVTDLNGSTPQWRIIRNPADSAGYHWDKVDASAPIAFSHSAWSAARLVTATQVLTPGESIYPAGQDAWLIYGPLDLSKFVYAHLSFEYYLDSQAGDTLLWGYSADGETFYGNSQSGPLGTWITDTFAFRANSTFQTVYLAFAFNSQADPQGLGAFVRNVQLTAEPVKYGYLPLVLNNYAAPTPTLVPPLFGYTFDQGDTDLNKWGGAFYNTGNTKFGQCIPGQCAIHSTTAHGNPTNSLRLYTNGLYSFIASSPNDIAPDDYDLYVDISPWVIYPKGPCSPYGCPDDDFGDWYGIIFNASSDTFGTNPSGFHYNKPYYRVYFYNVDSVKPIAIRLERCDGAANSGENSCHKLASSSLPDNFIGNASGFDTVRIQRRASGSDNIKVWLNGTLLITVTDTTYTGASHGKYGVFIFSWTQNATQNPPIGYEMQIDFDNILLYEP
ncbi:hypothetical protein TFLX_02439 [Thermoflexales bacterium]|nr:hypothetical protein TFLX_02439 [Thermoflexales bacterium]